MTRFAITSLALLAALVPFTPSAAAQKQKSSDDDRRDQAQAIERAWEDWADQYAARWEAWGEETEQRWETWAARHEQDWEAWAENQESVWAEFAARMEQGDEVDVDEILRLSLGQLQDMPLDGLVGQITGEVDRMTASGGPLAELEGLDEMIRLSVETALRAAEESAGQSGGNPQAQRILDQVLSEVRRASGDVRAAVDEDRRRATEEAASEWRRVLEQDDVKDLRRLLQRKRGAGDRETADGAARADRAGRARDEYERARVMQEVERARAAEELEALEDLQQEIEDRDHLLREMQKEIRALQREVRRLKNEKSGLRI